MNSRKKIHNTHTLHNHDVAHIVESKCPLQLETCIRTMLYNFRYSGKKDFYECKLSVIKNAFSVCTKALYQMNKQKGGSKTNGKNQSKNFIEKKIFLLKKREEEIRKKNKKLNKILKSK